MPYNYGNGRNYSRDSCRGCLCNGTCESGRYLCAVRHMRRRRTEKGVAYLCSKITEEATQKTFYPDILYRHPFPEAAVVTGMNVRRKASVSEEHVCQKADMPQNTDTANPVKLCDTELYNIELYDMEAAAGYQAAHHFFGPHQMFL